MVATSLFLASGSSDCQCTKQSKDQKVKQRTFRKLVKQLVGQVRNVNKRARPSDVEEEILK